MLKLSFFLKRAFLTKKMLSDTATYLGLLNPERYSRQRFRRSSITYFGSDITKKSWKFSLFTEGKSVNKGNFQITQ